MPKWERNITGLIFFLTSQFVFVLYSNAQLEEGPFLRVYEDNGQKGVVNQEGKEVIPAEYEEIGWSKGLPLFHDGVIGFRKNGKWGLITSENNISISEKYSNVLPAGNNLIIASRTASHSGQEFFGILDSRGKAVIPFIYAGLEVENTVVIAQKYDHNRRIYGLINLNNTPVLPFAYPKIYGLNNDLLVVSKPDGKITIVNHKGKAIVSYQIDSISDPGNNFLHVYRNGKIGLLSKNGTSILEPEFRKIEFSQNQISVLHLNTWYFLTADNNKIDSLLCDTLQEVGKDKYILGIQGRYWLATSKAILTDKAYHSITPFSNGFFGVTVDEKWGVISDSGEVRVMPEFDSIYMEPPYIYVEKRKRKNSIWSIYDTLGMQKSSYEYQNVMPLSEGLFPVKRNDKWGFMNRNGSEIIRCVFDEVESFNSGKAKVVFHKEHGVINNRGEWLISPGEKEITIINDTLYLEKTWKLTKLLNFDNELIYFTEKKLSVKDEYLEEEIDSVNTWFISFRGIIFYKLSNNEFTRHTRIEDNLFLISSEGTSGIVGVNGQVFIPFGIYDEIIPPQEGFLGVKKEGFYGFVDLDNKLRIANRYEAIQPFNEGLAAVMIKNKWGFIDKMENLIIQPVYDEVGNFDKSICIVRQGDRWGMINSSNQILQSIELSFIDKTIKNMWISKKDGQFGLIDQNGKTLIFPKYELLEPLKHGEVIVRRKGLFGALDYDGVIRIPFQYDNLQYSEHGDFFISMTLGQWVTFE